jgi:putative peptidoglycan lipid II flippase
MKYQHIFVNKLFNQNKNFVFVLWVVFFCYSICAAFIFQKLLLPLVPSLHAGGGLLSHDSVYFDSVAYELAQKIHLNGWSSWQLYPAKGVSGNVAILAALYTVFGRDPALIIPINALIHAVGGVLILLIGQELSGRKAVGTYAGVIAATLFVIFPSALNWYGQIHKDGYVIVGSLLILLTWVKAVIGQCNTRDWCILVLYHAVGVLFVASFRPYSLKLLLIATFGVWMAIAFIALMRRQLGRKIKLLVFFLVTFITLILGIQLIAPVSTFAADPRMGEAYATWESTESWKWQDTSWLNDGLENYIELAARTREGLIEYGLREKAKSMIDEDIAPHNVKEVVLYLPRALQVALLAPFPSTWFDSSSITRLVAVGEMLPYYLCFPGILLLLFYNRNPAVLVAIYFSCFFLMFYGFTASNLGTLYRLRYAYLFVMLLLGLLGWFLWLDKTGRLKRLINFLVPPAQIIYPTQTIQTTQQSGRKEAMSSGLAVMGMTLLAFIGFFLRDILMAHKFGLGAELDNFYIALLIPMFIVTVLCIPLGMAFVPFYLDIKERLKLQDSKMLLSGVSFWTMVSLLVICLILFLSGTSLLPLLYIKGSFVDMKQLGSLLDIALPILLFSGVVILGNSVLNANGRALLSSSAQLVVPIAAILALFLFGGSYGIKAVMYGMVVGQLLNLLIVQYFLKYYDVSLMPRPYLHNLTEFHQLFLQYLPLAVSAFFVAIATPVSTLLAVSLPGGGVSALNLGNKVVLFVTGMVSTAITTVMLPYFSVLIAKNHLISARRELSFFILFATFVSVPICIGLFIWSEPIVRIMFEGGTFDDRSTILVTRVMQYAVVQIPFFVCNSLLLKFAMAAKHVIAVSVVAFVGLFINIGASIFFIKHMGVAGIALGASVSMLSSTVLLVLVLVRYWHITRFDALVIMLNWLIFVTLLLCLHFESVPSIYVTILAYAILLIAYFSSSRFNKP